MQTIAQLQHLTIRMKDGRTIKFGPGVAVFLQGQSLGKSTSMLEQNLVPLLEHAESLVAIPRPDDSPNRQIEDMVRTIGKLRAEEFIHMMREAEHQKPPFWAKKFKGQRS